MKQKVNKTDALTNSDLQKIADLLEKQITPLATKRQVSDEVSKLTSKEDLKNLEAGLKTHINEGIDMVLKGIDNITEMLAEKERVDKLEKWVQKIGEKVGVKQV